jgi:hypothetical protein
MNAARMPLAGPAQGAELVAKLKQQGFATFSAPRNCDGTGTPIIFVTIE